MDSVQRAMMESFSFSLSNRSVSVSGSVSVYRLVFSGGEKVGSSGSRLAG